MGHSFTYPNPKFFWKKIVFVFTYILLCLWKCLSIKNLLFLVKCPVYGKSYLRNVQCPISMNFFFYKMSYLWNALSMKFPVYEMSCQWNVLSMKCPVYECPVYEMPYLWNVMSMNVLSMKCISMRWPSTQKRS